MPLPPEAGHQVGLEGGQAGGLRLLLLGGSCLFLHLVELVIHSCVVMPSTGCMWGELGKEDRRRRSIMYNRFVQGCIAGGIIRITGYIIVF